MQSDTDDSGVLLEKVSATPASRRRRWAQSFGGYLMMMLRILILAASALILGCSVLPNPKAQEQTRDLREVKTAGISFIYNTKDFGEIKIEKVQKATALDSSDDIDEGISPAHFCFNLKDKRPLPALEQGPRYFIPTYSFICAVPLKDSSVKDFSKAYPNLDAFAADLQKILRERPDNLKDQEDIPDFPPNDAGQSIISRFQYLDFRSGSGILFLTQYSNELQPNPVNNEELTLDFQGITKDGRYYVAARFAITNPALPRGIDFTNDIERDLPSYHYLREEEKELDGFSEESFRPSLKSLKALLSSIDIER
jgi:hypothetical protein